MESKRKRGEDVCVVCPIVYGSLAHFLGKKSEEATHKWTLFVRGPNDEDLSTFVAQVCFSLHPSFAEPLRIIDQPPFEVTEFGWGEFEAGIRIIFKDKSEQPIDIAHHLKLYPPLSDKPAPVSKKPVVAESYDELVFTNPKDDFFRALMMYKKTQSKTKITGHLKEYYTVFEDRGDLQQLAFIGDHISRELEVSKARLLQLEDEFHYLQNANANVAATATSAATSPVPSAPPAAEGSIADGEQARK